MNYLQDSPTFRPHLPRVTSEWKSTARCLLPSYASVRLNFGNLAIADRQILGGVRAQHRVLGWWDRNLNSFAKAREQEIARLVTVVGTIHAINKAKLDGQNRLPEIIQGIEFRDGIHQLQAAA